MNQLYESVGVTTFIKEGRRRMKKKITAGILIIAMVFATMGTPATTVEAAWLWSKVSKVATTVVTRHATSLLYKYSETELAGSTVSGLVYQYIAGPQVMKILSIMDTTEQISEQLVDVQEQLDDIEGQLDDIQDTLNEEFTLLDALITEDNVQEQYERIEEEISDYSIAYQTYEGILTSISEYTEDGELSEVELEDINAKYEAIYAFISDNPVGFVNTIYGLAELVSDADTVDIDADETGDHLLTDQTYIKAVKTYMEVNYPFTYQSEMALNYAATYTFQKQIEMLVLYTEITAWLEGELESNPEMDDGDQDVYDTLYDNYNAVYNATINSMNNAAEQMDIEGVIGYADLNVTLAGNEDVEVYQVQVYEYYTGTTYYPSDIYLFPKESLSAYTEYRNYNAAEEADHLTTDIIYTYIDELNYNLSYDKYLYYANAKSSDEVYGNYYMNVSSITDGSSLFDRLDNLNFSSFLLKNGIDSSDYDYVLFEYAGEYELDEGKTSGGLLDNTKEVTGRVVTDQATAIKANSLVGSTSDSDLPVIYASDLYNNGNTYVNIYKQVNTPEYSVEYDVSDLVTLTNVTTEDQEPGSDVSFTVEYDAPQVDIDEIIVTRDNGEEVVVYSPDYADDGSMECEFTMPYQGVTVTVTTIENRHNINVEDISNGTVAVDSTACYGDAVVIDVDADFGYMFSSLKVLDIDGNEVEVSEDNTFEMPDCDVSIEAVFAEIPDIDGLDGEGTEDDPYQIADAFDWATFVATVNKGNALTGVYLIFANDIDLTDVDYYTLGDSTNYFDGHLSGEGYEMTGIETFRTFNDDENYYFIGYLGENATVTDIVFTDTQWSSDKNSAIVGVNNGTLSDITVDITMSSDNTAFVYENNGTITNSINSSTMTGEGNYGFAVNNAGTIENCIFTGYLEMGASFVSNNGESGIISHVENNGDTPSAYAGIAGENYGLIEYATNNSDIYGCGIVVLNSGTVDNCINYGDLSGESMSYCGGIVGINSGIISNSGNYGNIGSSDAIIIGGIVGRMDSGATILNSFNQGDVTGSTWIGGLVGLVRIEPDPVEIRYCYTSGTVEVSEDAQYTGSAIGAIFGEYGYALITDYELVAEQINKNYAIIGADTPTQLMISNFDNATTQNQQIVSFIHKAVVTSFIADLNSSILNYSHSSVSLNYWTVAEGVNDSLPFHATSEYEAIFPEEDGDDTVDVSGEVTEDVEEDASEDVVADTGDNAPIVAVSIAMLLSVSMMMLLIERRKNCKE